MSDGPLMTVDPESSRPPFEQVRLGLEDAIASGTLAPEDRLPTIRALADELGLAVNTVARAYRELEAAGLVETRGRNGTFVVGGPSDARREAARMTAVFVAQMRELGIGASEMQALLRSEVER